MIELNTTQTVAVTAEENFDALTTVNMGQAFSLAQVDEDGEMHNVVIGFEQARTLYNQLAEFLG